MVEVTVAVLTEFGPVALVSYPKKIPKDRRLSVVLLGGEQRKVGLDELTLLEGQLIPDGLMGTLRPFGSPAIY